MKPRRLVWQLYPSFLLLTGLVLVAASWYFSLELRAFHYQQTAADLRARALLVEEQLVGAFKLPSQERLSALVKRLGQHSETRITLVRNDGLVLADSDENPQVMDNHGTRPEILEAFSGQIGVSVRFSNTLGLSLMYVAIPVLQDGELLGCVRTALPISDINATLGTIQWKLLIAGVVIAILLAPICWWFSRRLSKPLELMTAGVQRFTRGQLDVPLEETGTVETSRLAEAMNTMAIALSEQLAREVEQRSEIEAILGCMVEGIIAVDNDENLLRINQAAAQLFLVSNPQPIGKAIQVVIRQAELQRFIRRALNLQKPVEEELVLHGTKRRYLHVQATPLTGGQQERIGVLVVVHELTHLRRLEAVRRDFVANVSHELKTPITAIRGAVETLLDEVEIDKSTLRFLQMIFKQSERLNALVEDLLDLSRIEQGVTEGGWELELQPLLPLLERARLGCESLLNDQQIEVNIYCPDHLKVHANESLFEQAIINLLSNAIKYSDVGKPVEISAVEAENRVRIQVRDSGCGIAREHLPRIFERFYRVDPARSRNLGGTGLGLAIVKHVAQAHGGEVDVSSQPGEGSTFSILLPRS